VNEEPIWHPDNELRFVLRNGARVLQQKWSYWQHVSVDGERKILDLGRYHSEWRDVPEIDVVGEEK
jgi:hypothetical protein